MAWLWESRHTAVAHQHLELVFSNLLVVFHLFLRQGRSSVRVSSSTQLRLKAVFPFIVFSQRWISPSQQTETGVRSQCGAGPRSP